MSGQVVLYFEDQADALRFALAAGSVMAGEGAKFTSDLVQETARVTRIRLDAVNAGAAAKKSSPDARGIESAVGNAAATAAGLRLADSRGRLSPRPAICSGGSGVGEGLERVGERGEH